MSIAPQSVLERLQVRPFDFDSIKSSIRLTETLEMPLALIMEPEGTIAPDPIEIAVPQLGDSERE